MNKKELTELGIKDAEVQKAILKLHGLGIEKLKVDVKTLTEASETLTSEKEGLDKQLVEAGKTIDSFKNMDIEAVKKSAADWQEKAEAADKAKKETEEAKTAEVAKLKFDHALDEDLGKAGAKSKKSVRAHLNYDELKMAEDGSITGLDAQLETLVKDKEFLFDSTEEDSDTTPKIVLGTKQKSILGDRTVQAARDGAGLPEQKE